MKSLKSFSFVNIWFLLLFVGLIGAPLAVAQEPAPASTVTATITAPAAPAAPTTPAAAEPAKVTARKEDETETAPEAPAAADKPVNPNLTWLQRQVAAVAGIPTETTQAAALAAVTTERDTLRDQLATAQAAVETANAATTTAQAESAAAQAELATLNGFLNQLREAPASLTAPGAADTLTPAQSAAVTAINNGVAAELRAIGQPAASLPGPGATAPAPATPEKPTNPAALAAARNSQMASYWEKRKPSASSN